MNQAKEGTEQGRADALSDLRTSFESSWEPFRQNIQV
jgi:hypothetical protein